MPFKAELLRKKMKEEGKSRRFLAEATRKTERTVSRWLNGQNPPKGKDLDLIAMALKCRPQDFDPSYADEGLGVAMYARVSVASHNAYEMMRMRYGVTHKSIVELAPILFSMVAHHALKVPDDDLALHHEAIRLGLASPLPSERSYENANGFKLDQLASKQAACFGLAADDSMDASPRNLFCEALSRLCLRISDEVTTEYFAAAEPGEAPSAAGIVPDVRLLQELTGGDEALVKALVHGRIRLSKCWEHHQSSGGTTFEDFTGILRRELNREDDQRQTQLQLQREEGLAKLQAWSSYYEERYPKLAREYDELSAMYCHEDGWFPDSYEEELKQLFWANPYVEQRFIDANSLPSDQASLPLAGTLSPVAKRFSVLKAHRRQSKVQFEELGA